MDFKLPWDEWETRKRGKRREEKGRDKKEERREEREQASAWPGKAWKEAEAWGS